MVRMCWLGCSCARQNRPAHAPSVPDCSVSREANGLRCRLSARLHRQSHIMPSSISPSSLVLVNASQGRRRGAPPRPAACTLALKTLRAQHCAKLYMNTVSYISVSLVCFTHTRCLGLGYKLLVGVPCVTVWYHAARFTSYMGIISLHTVSLYFMHHVIPYGSPPSAQLTQHSHKMHTCLHVMKMRS